MKKLLLFSAGKESIFSLYAAKPDLLLQFDYGQKAFRKEFESAQYYADVLKIKHELLYVDPVLLNPPPGVTGGFTNSHVPMRNVLFLSLAANYAVTYGYGEVVFGATREHAYFDGCEEFGYDFGRIVEKLYGLVLSMPCGKLSAEQVAARLIRDDVDLAGFWSCDSDGKSTAALNAWGHCGVCPKCRGYLTAWATLPRNAPGALKKFYRQFYGAL